MQSRVRIFCCRGLFLLLCLVPTLAVLAFSIRHHWPGRAHRLASQLETTLGLRISVQAVRTLRPDLTRVSGVALADWEQGNTLLLADELTLQECADGWVVRAPHVVVQAPLPLVGRTVEGLLQRMRSTSVQLRADRVSHASSADPADAWLDVRLLLRSQEELAQGNLSCRLDRLPNTEATVWWDRRRDLHPPQTFASSNQDLASQRLASLLGLSNLRPPVKVENHLQLGRGHSTSESR